MRKYLYGFKLHFLNSFHYRFNTVLSLVFGNLSLLVTIFFWNLIYSNDMARAINGFTLSHMITYFILGDIFRRFVLQDSGFDCLNMIKNGILGAALLKPMDISMSVYFRNLAGGVTGLIPQAVFVLILTPFIKGYLTIQTNLPQILFTLAFLAVSAVSSHLLWFLLGYAAFWLEEANAVMWSFAVLLNVLTGMFIPLDFFPEWSIKALELLPFASWGYIPAKTYLGLYDIKKQIMLFVIHAGWIIVLLIINKLVWKHGIRRFVTTGG